MILSQLRSSQVMRSTAATANASSRLCSTDQPTRSRTHVLAAQITKDFLHLPDARGLLSSSQFCEFCALIRDVVLRDYPGFEEWDIHQPLILQVASAYHWKVDAEPASPTVSRIAIRLPKLESIDILEYSQLMIMASRGTACQNLHNPFDRG